jgi:hypothetical protein
MPLTFLVLLISASQVARITGLSHRAKFLTEDLYAFPFKIKQCLLMPSILGEFAHPKKSGISSDIPDCDSHSQGSL